MKVNGTMKIHEVLQVQKLSHRLVYKPAEEMPEIKWLSYQLGLRPGAVHILTGFSNAGKTFFAGSLALSVIHNLPLLETIKFDLTGSVVHVDYEQGVDDGNLYYWRLANGLGLKDYGDLDYYYRPIDLDDSNYEEVKKKYTDIMTGHTLCIIDCLEAAMANKTDMNAVNVRSRLDMLSEISAKTQCTVLILHHEAKVSSADPMKKAKGNGAIIAAAGGSLHLSRDEKTDVINLIKGKRRMSGNFAINYTLNDSGVIVPKFKFTSGIKLNVCAGKPKDQLKRHLLWNLEECPGKNKSELESLLKESGSRNETREMILECESEELVRQEKKKYYLTEAGKSYLVYANEGEDNG